MEYQAKHRYADMSARKIRQFADLIRGRVADEALELLRYLPEQGRPAARSRCSRAPWATPRIAAPANKDELVVVESRVDGGPIMKRIMPRAAARRYPIKRRYAHIVITLVGHGRRRCRGA